MTDLHGTLAIAASALSAERLRLDVIAANLANASTTRTAAGGPYRRRDVVLAPADLESDFADTLAALGDPAHQPGVHAVGVVEDPSPPRLVYDPGHPDADAQGYVAYPNVNPILEMVDLTTATRAYEANVQVMNATKRLADAALQIGS